MNKSLIATIAVLSLQSLSAQIYPLSENTWSNPDFVSRFMGSYGMDTTRTPSITSDEKVLLDTIVPLISSDPKQAIAQLKLAITPEMSAAITYTLANLYLQEGDITNAIATYEEAIKKFPNFLRAYKNLGISYIQEGKYKEALPMLLKAIELGAEGDDIYGLLGYSYINLGNASAALQAYEMALFFNPQSRDWRMGKVQSLSNLNRSAELIPIVDQLIVEYPKQFDLLNIQANAFVAIGRSEDAAATLEMIRAKGIAKATALMLLGDIYLNFQQADLAAEVYREAAQLEDMGSSRLLRMARRLASVAAWGEVDNYIELVKASGSDITAEDDLELLNLQAQSDLAQNRTAAAAEKLTEVVSRDPLNGEALLLLANYYWQTGDVERAEIYFDRASKVESVAVRAFIDQARMLVSLREFSKAVVFLEKAQTLKPQSHIGQFLDRVSNAARATGS